MNILISITWSIFLIVSTLGPAKAEHALGDINEALQTLPAHTPPALPPISVLKPQSELLSFPEGEAKDFLNPRIDVLTYHYDNKRSGWNPFEVDLTPKKVASPQFSLLKTIQVDGNVFAQPLLVSNFMMPDGIEHDILIVAAGHNNTVYAFDANTFALIWVNTNLGKSQDTVHIACGDVVPEYGVTSTPVVVRKSKDSATLYIVTATEPNPHEFHTFINALDLKTGKVIGSPKEIAPVDTLKDGSQLEFSSKNQWSRAGLAYNSGSIYVSIGSHCDNDRTHLSGWILRYSENLDMLASAHTISTPKGQGLASIWMTGFAPAIDDDGNIFVVTGNGDFTPSDNYSESVLKLDGKTLKPIDYFRPWSYGKLPTGEDADFGSGGVILFSGDFQGKKKDLAAAVGKDPVLYLLDQANLGKNQPNDAGALQSLQVQPCPYPSRPCTKGVWGGPAEFMSQKGFTLFVQAQDDVLRSYRFAGGVTPALTSTGGHGSTTAGYGGSIPVVSSNGGADGVVWLLRRTEPIELEAYDADTLGSPLCSANIGNWSNPAYGKAGNSFLTPIVANGRVYAAAYGIVKVFGLASKGASSATKACGTSVSSSSPPG